MDKKNEKRSSGRGIGKDQVRQAVPIGGVGGRQAPSPPPDGGGGYQDICTILNFGLAAAQKKRDPRLDELREMGLQRVWLVIAEDIGVDSFLKVWRILDSDQSSIGDDGRLLVPIRSYSTFLRYQRNRYIEALDNRGMKPTEIREKLNKQLCETISLRHISRIIRRG